jgi:hypothetical protein
MGLQSSQLVTCHGPIGIAYTRLAEKLWCLENLKQPYLHNHSMDFYRTKTKLYLEASFFIVYGKEDIEHNIKFWCNMPNSNSAPASFEAVLKQFPLVVGGIVASRVGGLSVTVVTSQDQHCRERKHFSSGRIASGHLTLVLVQTHKCNLSYCIMM